MGILTKIENLFYRQASYGEPQAPAQPTEAAPAPAALSGPYSSYLDVASLYRQGSSMSVSAVYRCVNFLADSVATLSLRYLICTKQGVFVEDRRHRYAYLLGVQPCDWMSSVDFLRQLVVYYHLRGNAYIVPMRSGLEVDQLILVNPDCVSHNVYNDTYTISDPVNGVCGVFPEDEVIHIKNFSTDGKRGLSTLGYARMSVGIAQKGETETSDRFASGGAVRGIIGNDMGGVDGFGEYADEELAKTAEDIDTQFRAGKRIIPKPGAVSWIPIALTSADMQFLETRKFTVTEICRFFGVHPSFVFADSGSNYKSAEMANIAFLSTTLNPLLRKIEVELQRKLISPDLVMYRKFEFDRRGLYACNLESGARYRKILLESGQATVNELRAESNMPAVPGGDSLLVSANLKTIDQIVAEAPKQ